MLYFYRLVSRDKVRKFHFGPQSCFDLCRQVWIVPQELLGILSALPQANISTQSKQIFTGFPWAVPCLGCYSRWRQLALGTWQQRRRVPWHRTEFGPYRSLRLARGRVGSMSRPEEDGGKVEKGASNMHGFRPFSSLHRNKRVAQRICFK